mmetsp:Transcript_11165/g.35041  ORF Transcript_11165/g.35041 Transcript_11165/m.35041 type:complete len:251 (+) Transcript_11165:812-1564(+)
MPQASKPFRNRAAASSRPRQPQSAASDPSAAKTLAVFVAQPPQPVAAGCGDEAAASAFSLSKAVRSMTAVASPFGRACWARKSSETRTIVSSIGEPTATAAGAATTGAHAAMPRRRGKEAAAAAAACAEDVDVEVGAERATPTSEAVAPAFFAPAPTRDQVEGSLPTLLTSPNANVVGKAAGKDGAAKKASSDKAFEDGGAKKASSDKAFEDAGAKKASSDKAFQDAGAKKASSDKAFQEAAKTDTGLQL